MTTADRVALWLPFCLVGGICGWSWYWYVRSIIFYYKNGFDSAKISDPNFRNSLMMIALLRSRKKNS